MSTNAASQDVEGTDSGAGAATAFRDTKLVIGYTGAEANAQCLFSFRFFMKTGNIRFYNGAYTLISAAGGATTHAAIGGVWNETATAITSLRLHSDKADGFKVGSYILWRAIPLGA